MFRSREKRIYLDHAAAAPVHHEVLAEMLSYFTHTFGNAGSVHREGVEANDAISSARMRLARVLRVRPREITFTSGGTEANNIAIRGTFGALVADGVPPEHIEIITIQTEHPATLKTVEALEKEGARVVYMPLTEEGLIDFSEIEKCFSEYTRLVTVAYINSEIGVIQNIKRLSRTVRDINTKRGTSVRIHIDAAQAPLWLPCALDALGVDMLSLDAGKCNGPKGMGVLVHRGEQKIAPLLKGGEQEGGLRPGTENTPLIVGGVSAIVRAQEGFENRSVQVRALRDYAIEQLLALSNVQIVINGSLAERVANNINISLIGYDTEYAVLYLDARGIAVSTKSACGGKGGDGSHVVRAVTKDESRATSTLRISMSEDTTKEDIDECVETLKSFLVLYSGTN